MDNFFGFGHANQPNTSASNNDQDQNSQQTQAQTQSEDNQAISEDTKVDAQAPANEPKDFTTLDDELKELNNQFEHKRPSDPFSYSNGHESVDSNNHDEAKTNQSDSEPELSAIFAEPKSNTEPATPASENHSGDSFDYGNITKPSTDFAPQSNNAFDGESIDTPRPTVPSASGNDESFSDVEKKLLQKKEDIDREIKKYQDQAQKIDQALEKINGLKNQKLEILKTIDGII